MLGSPDTILVVGGGAAAQSCVATYREAGGDTPVLVVSADDRVPYFRPAVSKEYLAGEQERDDLLLVGSSWYADHDIEVLLDVEVTGLDVATRVAATSLAPIRWGRCVLATGSAAAPLPVPGGDDRSLVTIRSASDTERLLARIAADPAPVAVIGSGFVGCEVAAGLRGRGLDVTMISAEARPQQDRLGEAVGVLVEGWLVDHGVRLLGGPRRGVDRPPRRRVRRAHRPRRDRRGRPRGRRRRRPTADRPGPIGRVRRRRRDRRRHDDGHRGRRRVRRR